MYWRPDAATDSAELDITITESGEVDNVFNGIPDWVYEEEVLGVNYAHYLNDIGDTVAYAQFNDTLVRDFQYPFYGDQHVRKQIQRKNIFSRPKIFAGRVQRAVPRVSRGALPQGG